MFGSLAARPLPPQDWRKIQLCGERYVRSAEALALWSTVAKKCVDYLEGRQWAREDIEKLRRQGRSALTFNKIKPLVLMVMGYFLGNQTEIRYLPSAEGGGPDALAKVITHIFKAISQSSRGPYVDASVYLDGLLTGRGYWDGRLDQATNVFGELKWSCVDPFTVYLDPDGQDYDLNKSSYVIVSKMISLDEIELNYGSDALARVQPLAHGMAGMAVASDVHDGPEEVTPFRRFGGEMAGSENWWLRGLHNVDWVDTARKTIRLIDMQHYVWTERWHFYDLETGDLRPVNDNWSRDRVQAVLDMAAEEGKWIRLMQCPVRRVRWTTLAGDTLVYDRWSLYDSFTITPFFPYFRRGSTQGMVEALLDPQDEKNKRRNARINITSRSANGGWMYPKGSLDPQQKENLEEYGASPGVHVEFDSKGGKLNGPTQIAPSVPPMAMQQLEEEADVDFEEISNVNKAALGHVDNAAMSGRAITARQKSALVGHELYQHNWRQSNEIRGEKGLEVIQQHYKTPRIFRITGQDGKSQVIPINRSEGDVIINQVALGKYAVKVDEQPLSASFLDGQMREMMTLKQIGVPIPDDFLVDASSFGRKDELKAALAQQRALEQSLMGSPAMPGGAPPRRGPGPGASLVGPDGGSLPGNQEPGAPMPGASAGPMG